MRSTSGLLVRTMRSTHASTRSVSSPFGSSGLPSREGSGPTSAPWGVLSSESTASSSGLPIHAARSAAVGPKPARQNRRSTIACDMDVGLKANDPPGGACRRWRRGLTVRAWAGLCALCGFFLVTLIGYSLSTRLSWLRMPLLARALDERLERRAGRALARYAEVARAVADVVPDDSGQLRHRLAELSECTDPGTLVAASGRGAGLGDPERLLRRELLDRAVGRQEQIGRGGPGEALRVAEVVGVGAHEIDLLRSREVHLERVLLVVGDAARVHAPEQLDLLARGLRQHLAHVLPGGHVVARAIAVDGARPRVPRRVGIGHRTHDRAVRQGLDLEGERRQVLVELAGCDRAEAIARGLDAVGALVRQPADDQPDAALAGELDQLGIEGVAHGQIRRDGLDVLAGLLLKCGERRGGLVLVDADVDAGDGGSRTDRERAEGQADGTGCAVHFFTSRVRVLLDRAFPTGALPVTVTVNLPDERSFFGIVTVTLTLRRVAASGLSMATRIFFLRERTTWALPIPSARKRTGMRHFFLLSGFSFFLIFCESSVICGASVQAWVSDGGETELIGPSGAVCQPIPFWK